MENITEVYTIERIKQSITKVAGDTNASSDHINGIVFAFLTKFNIDDSQIDNILAMRWYVSQGNFIHHFLQTVACWPVFPRMGGGGVGREAEAS